MTGLILARMKDGAEKQMSVKNEAEMHPSKDDEPLTIAAQDMMQAFHDKSVLGLRDALRAFIDLCGSEPDADDKEA